MALFDFLRRDPIREVVKETKKLLQVPAELIATTADSAAKAWNVLSKVGLSHAAEHEVLREICAYHFMTVIVAMNSVRDPSGRIDSESWNRDAAFLLKSVNDILSDMESKGHSDVQMLHPLVEQETANLTIAYFCRDQEVLQTTEQDVRELGRKYNPKWLSGDFASTVFSFLVRIVRVSRLETVQPTDVRTAAVRALTNDLLKGLANLEQKVMRCMPK